MAAGTRARAAGLRDAALLTFALAACTGPQSTLDPAGESAERIARLFWVMSAGAVVVWLVVVALALYAYVPARRRFSVRAARLLILGGGVVFPTVVLAALLAWGMAMLPGLLRPAPEGSLKIRVVGEQWWWRVQYPVPGGGHIELANEIRLPVGEPVEFELESPDVIHSFWIPSLGGKMDMIPGRRTRLRLHPTKTGLFRGVCAEFCGASHALMLFTVVVEERPDFDRWLAQQARPAAKPSYPLAARGASMFLSTGCGACHTIRGTDANGVVGPELTHVGSRLSLAAGRLENDAESFARWIAHPKELKPNALMPAFDMLPPEELRALAAYLESLE